MPATLIQQKYKDCGGTLPPEFFTELAAFRKTPLGAALQEIHTLISNSAAPLGRMRYEKLERAMKTLENEIAAILPKKV